MRAIEFREFGDPSRLQLVERPDPRATMSHAVVRVESASVNMSDVKNVAGRMKQTTLPRIPGRDYSGMVIEGPREWVGAPVWGTGGDTGFTRDGTHAEMIDVPVESLARKPEQLSHDAAASSGVTFLTAWIGVVEYARLAAGETLAVIGAGGGVGGAAIQIAKSLAAVAIAIDRRELPADSPAAKLADQQIQSSGDDLPAGVANVVLDTAGGPMFAKALKLLKHRGRIAEITGGPEPVSFHMVDFYHNELQLFGVDSLKRDCTAASRVLRELSAGFDRGVFLAPLIAHALPLEKAREAYQLVADGQPGRVVLKP